MEQIIDIYNKLLNYNNSDINFIIDNKKTIWFNFKDINEILKYSDRKDVLRQYVEKEEKKMNKEIKWQKKNAKHPNSIYINESGLFKI